VGINRALRSVHSLEIKLGASWGTMYAWASQVRREGKSLYLDVSWLRLLRLGSLGGIFRFTLGYSCIRNSCQRRCMSRQDRRWQRMTGKGNELLGASTTLSSSFPLSSSSDESSFSSSIFSATSVGAAMTAAGVASSADSSSDDSSLDSAGGGGGVGSFFYLHHIIPRWSQLSGLHRSSSERGMGGGGAEEE
jgi:hypothetical protein